MRNKFCANSIRFSIHYNLPPHFDQMELDSQLFQAPLSMHCTRVGGKIKCGVTLDGFGPTTGINLLRHIYSPSIPSNQLMVARRSLWLLFRSVVSNFSQIYFEISVFFTLQYHITDCQQVRKLALLCALLTHGPIIDPFLP